MVHPKQIRELARSPSAYVKFQATGQLPRMVRPASPLITLLEAIHPRYLPHIIGVTVGPELGYSGSRTFHSAAQALQWVRPEREVLESRSFPAESWRLKNFRGKLHLEDLLDHSSDWPEQILQQHPRLRRPAPRQAEQDPPSPPRNETPGCG